MLLASGRLAQPHIPRVSKLYSRLPLASTSTIHASRVSKHYPRHVQVSCLWDLT